MKLFEVTNTTWENLQIATHKSVSRILYWFVLCNFHIFSGCVCHLEQLHAQSPFLFPIVFSINLIPFFDICSVLAVYSTRLFGYVLLHLGRWPQQLLFVVLAGGLWFLTAGCHIKSTLFPQPPLKQKCAPWSRWEKAYIQVRPSSFSQSNALREYKHCVQICRSSLSAAVQTLHVSVEPHLSTALKDRSVVP